MTAEVALLNKTSVVLAADSAMTVAGSTTKGSTKIYPGDKLFALTKHHPVGVMIYHSDEFMGVPWETLIKMYRHSLGSKSRASVAAYVDDLLAFISKEPFTNDERDLENLLRMARGAFAVVLDSTELADDSTGGDDALLLEVIEQQRAVVARWDESPSMAEIDAAQVVVDAHDHLDGLIDRMFGNLVTPPVREALGGLVEDLIRSSITTPNHSGVVVAGFGEDEFFPTLVHVTTEGIIAGTLKHDVRRTVDIARDGTSAQIVPFAQTEMVTRFMEGVDPEFLDYLHDSMGETSRQLVMEVLDAMGIECSEEEVNAVREAAASQAERFLEQSATVRRRRFVAPIMDIVELLPKEELADMAEALVNLTALKRRVSLDAETVGGPIDVAVISKGDGMIWIKRKHYFDPALNPSYFRKKT